MKNRLFKGPSFPQKEDHGYNRMGQNFLRHADDRIQNQPTIRMQKRPANIRAALASRM